MTKVDVKTLLQDRFLYLQPCPFQLLVFGKDINVGEENEFVFYMELRNVIDTNRYVPAVSYWGPTVNTVLFLSFYVFFLD